MPNKEDNEKEKNWKEKKAWRESFRPITESDGFGVEDATTQFAKMQNTPDERKMSREEGKQKGKDILVLMADLYQLIEWEGDEEEAGDPYLKMTFYKSGKFTIETYKDNEVSEFTIDEIANK